MAESSVEKVQALRRLIINILLSALVAIAVFVVCIYFFVIPRLYQHERRIQQLEDQVATLQEGQGTDDEEEEEPSANAPAAPSTNAPAAPAATPDAGH